jgi:hypothetical protein
MKIYSHHVDICVNKRCRIIEYELIAISDSSSHADNMVMIDDEQDYEQV